MPTLRASLKRIRTRLQADEIRIPIQTASAVIMAYFATSFMDREHVSWGAFSALFVVQASIGGTISAALGRIAGAILGAIIGAALVILLGDAVWATLVALLVGVGLMSFLTAKWPQLAYGLVTVTIIAVAPDFYVVEGAFKKVLAIAIGSVCGMLAAFAVMPVLARRTEQQHLATALRACGDYIVECTACLLRDKSEKNRKAQDRIQQAIEHARLRAREARVEDQTPTMGLSPFTTPLLPEIDRLSYTLVLIDRFSDEPISEALCRNYKDALQHMAKAMKASLDQIADAVYAGKTCGAIDEAQTAYSTLTQRVEESVQHENLTIEEKQQLLSIKAAYGAVLSNIDKLAHQVQCRDQR